MKRNKKFPCIKVDVVVSMRKQIRALVKNVLDGGICVTTYEPLEKGKLLTLEVSLPGMDTLIIKGKVMWSLEIGSTFFENGIDFSTTSHYIREMAERSMN